MSTVTTARQAEPGKQSHVFPPSPPQSEKAESETMSTTEEDDVEIPLPPPSEPPTKVLDIDANTPDNHVPRDPRMIRLTGVHPFNTEAPLTTLYDQGFLTPPKLFYVRNHGHVPQVLDHEIPSWKVSIEGLVENPITLTFTQILEEFEQVTIPITMVCAGNRRKEQNMVRKSQGFSWGAAALSTSLWTGPMLADVIERAKPMKKAQFLCMEGADQLPNGKYGTSIRLSWVQNRERGIMLAHKQNGEPLTPDHGRPIRVVIPGQIGGRSVKWLTRIILSDKPSDNWYHKYDNRVLPTMVTPEMSKKDDKWWNDERYAIYDLSVNSAIVYPQNDETLSLGETCPEFYRFRGYAYSGGMRRITRVELSLDKGNTWELADIDYPEDRYRETERELYGGRLDMASRDVCYCWCFWQLPIAVNRLVNAEDVVLRAMDESMTIQPRDMYWSVLGMMHNAWFRIAIRKDSDGMLRFEHPTVPMAQPKGWMDRVKKEGGDFANGNWGEKVKGQVDDSAEMPEPVKKVKMTNDEAKRIIEIEELRAHDNKDEPWFVVSGEVYDGTPFLKEHPGGAVSIISAAGQDVTDEFVGIHSESACEMMPKYHIGTLSPAAREALLNSSLAPDTSAPTETFLNPRAWRPSTFIAKKQVSWDSRIFTFALDSETQRLGLPVGQHLMIRLKDANGKTIVRPYTPLSTDAKKGVVDILIKVYFDDEKTGTKGGEMTLALDALPLGQKLEFKGPLGKFTYLGGGQFSLDGNPRTAKSMAMVCGGSGITPIFAVLRAVMEDPQDPTTCFVLDGNRQEADILCREELDELHKANPSKMQLVHTLTAPTHSWTGRTGRIDKGLVEEAAKGTDLWLVCGPPGMEKSVREILTGMGVQAENMVFF
ncbi:nitrate reductase [Sphaerosporella brunnea]|uniref:Nitrate reductase n=1 Tax=Sphaerosporella brunnea TaxID=1250544 RepID=A0A5J5EGR3_9PEZI|nr:nitrate reductase [Sphaerosporella brunnea]